MVFSRYFKQLSVIFRFGQLPVNLLKMVILVLLVFGVQISKSNSVTRNMPFSVAQDLLVVGEKVLESPKVEEIEGVVKGVAVVEKESKPDVNKQSEPTQHQAVANGDNKALCRDIDEDWKMIPDPKHEGQYIICNTAKEEMTTASELNAAQNSYRSKHGLGTLNINAELCKIAADRAVEVSKNFSHDGFKNAVQSSGVGKNSYGENIASGPLSGVHFVEWSWDKSPGHRENMLGDWTDGCGGVSGKYAVFLFAK